MIRLLSLISFCAVLMLFAACANPADNAAKAVVSEAVSPTPAAAATQGTKLAFANESSSIDFVGSKVTGTEAGSFKKFSGAIDLVEEKPEKSRVTVEIDLSSVEAKVGKLTEHLKSPDFFDVAKYPQATFVSTEIKPGGEKGASHTVTGILDLHGVKKNISFPATINVASDAVTVASEFAINRKDFGIVYAGKADDLIRDEVVLKLSVKAPRR
ncbi:MAG TPA: YceI family protein [Blastocatellia bacterium]|nr:YceI family protein [Blastocatellia bacterium]